VTVPRPTVHGRDADIRRIEEYVASLDTGGSVLLVVGDAGLGKSVLLDIAAELAARRTRVLRCAGVEFEVEVAYSGLHEALRPLRAELRKLDETPRSAVQVALGLSVAAPQEPLVVANGVLDLLERAAAERPLLIVVDDAQWLDRATAFALAFVARRLAGTRLGLLVAARTGADNVFESLRVARHELAPLTDPAAHELLAEHFPDLDQRLRARLVAEAQGNPLALLELPVPLAGSHADARGLPAPLPLTERLQSVFAARLDELDARTREVLLLAALEGSGRLDVLERATAARGGLQPLAEAERRHLLAVDDDTRSVRFRHPLVRGAVVGASAHAERRAVHQALAAVFADEPDRHVWHRAAAAAGPDPAVALLLEQAAHRALRRGDGIGAVTTLVRSADLTPDASDRSHRLAEAAYIGANLSGQADSVAPLIDAARLPDATPRARLYATLAAATLLYEGGGEIETAHRMLVGGIEAHAGSWDETDDAVQAALALLAAISVVPRHAPGVAAVPGRAGPAATAALGPAPRRRPDRRPGPRAGGVLGAAARRARRSGRRARSVAGGQAVRGRDVRRRAAPQPRAAAAHPAPGGRGGPRPDDGAARAPLAGGAPLPHGRVGPGPPTPRRGTGRRGRLRLPDLAAEGHAGPPGRGRG
jgi:hypothetical protein